MPPDPFRDRGAPEYPVLASAVRRLLDAAVDARPLDADTLHRIAHTIDRASSELEAALAGLPTDERNVWFDGQRVPMPHWEFEATEHALVARGAFTNGHTGPPGTVHGGWVAYAFDEVLGWANVHAGFPAMTGKLTIRYRKPTPTNVPVEFRVTWPRVEGKRVHARGTLTADDAVTAEADGLFVHFRGRRDAVPFERALPSPQER
ncbi:MAG TPA: PaaI family thioesterase [Acidimicrobiia bacterium]|nr:PaaI family thioesterase [Acidimicrobiia bacterium]